jgi:hypothetical protein
VSGKGLANSRNALTKLLPESVTVAVNLF